MKTYIITLSKTFPKGHKREGEATNFRDKFLLGIGCPDCRYVTINPASGEPCYSCERKLEKLHTIRANYDLWKKRVKEIQDGKAVLSIRQWTGKPYRSKQEIIAVLDASSGIAVQKLYLLSPFLEIGRKECRKSDIITILAKNDGLSVPDFEDWFKSYNKTEPLAIIHFTKFRY